MRLFQLFQAKRDLKKSFEVLDREMNKNNTTAIYFLNKVVVTAFSIIMIIIKDWDWLMAEIDSMP